MNATSTLKSFHSTRRPSSIFRMRRVGNASLQTILILAVGAMTLMGVEGLWSTASIAGSNGMQGALQAVLRQALNGEAPANHGNGITMPDAQISHSSDSLLSAPRVEPRTPILADSNTGRPSSPASNPAPSVDVPASGIQGANKPDEHDATPKMLGTAGAAKGRDLIQKHHGDLDKAANDAINQRHEHYDHQLAQRIAERDGLNAEQQRELHDRIRQDQSFRSQLVQSLPQSERESLHCPVLTNADWYLETRYQSEICGTLIAADKSRAYGVYKFVVGDRPTDGDGRSSSPLGIGQWTAVDEAIRDAKRAGHLPVQTPVRCIEESQQELKVIFGGS